MKKNKKKGFTLVELLAVIVVLAIILVIAVPKILDVIKSSRENSLISSVKLIARNVEQKLLTNEVLGENTNTLSCDDVADINTTDYKSCTISVNDDTKEVIVTIEGQGKFNGYTCSGTKNNVTCEEDEGSNINALTIEEALDLGFVWYDIDANSVAIGLEGESSSTPTSHVEFTTLNIPTSIGGKKVVHISDWAFTGNENLTSVTIPNSVTSIGYYAFEGCTSLESVTIPNSVTSIEDAFFDTPWFDSIGYDENGLIIIGSVLYDVDENVTSVTIPNSVTSIGEQAFDHCDSLESVIIPSSVTSIGYEAFIWCVNLESITIPNSVTSIGQDAFNNTPWFDNNVDENGLLIINGILCDGTEDISGNVTIPNSVTSIGEGAFYDCNSLESVTIPNSVTSIGAYAFEYCENLESIIIPNGVTSIGDNAFEGTPWLENLDYDENGLLIIGSMLYDVDNNISDSVTIPSGVTSIGNWAFAGCTSLESITIPNGVTSIGDYAFAGCTSLTNVTIPNSVTSIGGYAFSGCENLTSITISSGITSIGAHAFMECTSLENVNFVGNNFKTCNNSFNDTPWFNDNKTGEYIKGENYLIRTVEMLEWTQ